MVDDQPGSPDATPPADRIDGLDARMRRLERRLDGRASDDALSTVVVRRALLPPTETLELEALAKWVDWLQDRYATAGDWLHPCWWRHGLVVEELAALRTAWRGVYESDEAVASSAALDWHDAAERCRERIRQSVSTGPGCTAVSHKPDPSVTDDLRWAEEQRAMRGTTSAPVTVEGDCTGSRQAHD